MSPKIQNKLTQLLSKKVKNIIFKQIETAHFFSVIMDTTQDINRKDQLIQVTTHVSISEVIAGRPTNLQLLKAF